MKIEENLILPLTGLTGKGWEDSLIMWPSMTWVSTCGFTTAFGVDITGGGTESAVSFDFDIKAGRVKVVFGWPKFGIGGIISFVNVGGGSVDPSLALLPNTDVTVVKGTAVL